jgi:type II secretory pathway pseudopilin PulG
MRMPRSRRVGDQPSEQGAALVLAIVFLVAMSILVVVLGNLATEASTTTSDVRYQTTIEANAESAATFAIQQVRRSYGQAAPYGTPGNPTTPQNCLPSGALSGPLVTGTPYHNSLTVYCAGTQAGSTRTVNFYVCGPSSVSAAQCTSPTGKSELLFASVTYFDSPSGDLPLSASCGPTSNATCGVTMSVNEWDVRTADS